MDSIAPALNRACQILDTFIGTIGTILIVALLFGLFFLCVGLTILVLWKSFSFGFRFAVLKAWVKATDYLTRYFHRLRRYGLRKTSSTIAVVCGLTVWTGIVFGFAFGAQWREVFGLTAAALLVLYAWGWWERGPSARFWKFSRGFLEPTMALALPTFVAKSGDFLFKLVMTTVRMVL
jgi:hypothetical protein